MRQVRIVVAWVALAAVGCGSMIEYRNSDLQFVPPGLGDGLPQGTVLPEESGLDFDSVYKMRVLFAERGDEALRATIFARFWPNGRVAITNSAIPLGGEFTVKHADDLRRADVGMYVVNECGLFVEVFQWVTPNRQGFRIFTFTILPDGDLLNVYIGGRNRIKAIHQGYFVKRIPIEGMKYQPQW